ncbi:hypothetical protein QQS21_005681 [Conoideocrella luteorostrata]|uniref:Uncharacterized protein n=1 Tax=Conoideocrella luteorostrata TaxID=1105319 RepID=A0AAJ0CPB0_9HYPO|nr:hypothetical protein QQS21_005681 [Conoideocrella luteorostrata]
MTSTQARKPVILNGIRNWYEWQNYVCSRIDPATWEAIRPEGHKEDFLVKPIKPVISSFNPSAQDETALTDRQRNNLIFAMSNHKEDLKHFTKQQEHLIRAREVIFGSVEERFAKHLGQKHTILEWMNSLANSVPVEEPMQMTELAKEY